jgi:hypothetical protein
VRDSSISSGDSSFKLEEVFAVDSSPDGGDAEEDVMDKGALDNSTECSASTYSACFGSEAMAARRSFLEQKCVELVSCRTFSQVQAVSFAMQRECSQFPVPDFNNVEVKTRTPSQS